MDSQSSRAADLARSAAAIADAVETEEGPLTERKRRIIEAAVLCFAEQGFEATATSAIARRAGVAEATIFRHFATKKDLLIRLVRPVASRLIIPAALDELSEVVAQSGGSFATFARRIIESRLAFADRYDPLVRILLQELPLHADLRDVIRAHAVEIFASRLPEVFQRFRASGQIRDVPLRRAIQWFGSLMFGFYIARTTIGDEIGWDDPDEIEAMIAFLLHGIGGNSADLP